MNEETLHNGNSLEEQQAESNQISNDEGVDGLTNRNNNALLYSVDDTPPWHLSVILGFQVMNQLL